MHGPACIKLLGEPNTVLALPSFTLQYAVVKEAARPHELARARELFWTVRARPAC